MQRQPGNGFGRVRGLGATVNGDIPGQPQTSLTKIPFWYRSSNAVIPANGQQQTSILFSADSKFEMYQISGSSIADAATDFAPNNFQVQITDSSTGYQFSNQAVDEIDICSTARFPNVFADPIIFPPNALVSIVFYDLTGSGTTAHITFVGFKVYNGS
jgi:hypothetical protein